MPTWALYDSKWDWARFLQDSFEKLARQRTRALVIDVRGNEGGLAIGDALLAHLIDRALPLPATRDLVRYRKVPDDLVPYLDTWDSSFRDWGNQAVPFDERYLLLNRHDAEHADALQPKTPRFHGRVFAIIGPSNSSATFEFAQQLKRTGLGTLVGQATGGNQRGINGGAFFFLRLPNSKIEVDVPLIAQLPTSRRPDAGIEPDKAVLPSVSDIATGVDSEMVAVRSLVRTK